MYFQGLTEEWNPSNVFSMVLWVRVSNWMKTAKSENHHNTGLLFSFFLLFLLSAMDRTTPGAILWLPCCIVLWTIILSQKKASSPPLRVLSSLGFYCYAKSWKTNSGRKEFTLPCRSQSVTEEGLGKNWNRDMEFVLLTACCISCSVCFLINLRTTCPAWHCPQRPGPFHTSCHSWKFPWACLPASLMKAFSQ